MDIVHHALIGGAGFAVVANHDQPLVGAAFVLGSVFPDLDVAFMALGKRFYLHNHQGITHSLLLSPVYAVLLAGLLWALPAIPWDGWMIVAAWVGLFLHVMLDWSNTYRIELFGPVLKRRYSLDALFFIDSVALGLTALFYLGYVMLQIDSLAVIYPLLFVGYALFKLWLQRRVRARLRPLFAIPSSLNPLVFYILARERRTGQGELHGYLYNALTGRESAHVSYAEADAKYLAMAQTSGVFRDMQHITRAFHIIETEQDETGTRIVAADLAVRNFGGRFARTELQFDPQGRLIHEVANI